LFEKHKAKKAAKQYEADLAKWKAQRESSEGLLDLAQTFAGEPSTEMLLKPGEALFASVTGRGSH
jgi:hypothetical protein